MPPTYTTNAVVQYVAEKVEQNKRYYSFSIRPVPARVVYYNEHWLIIIRHRKCGNTTMYNNILL